MNPLSKITDILHFGKKEQSTEYYFALNIGSDRLTAALWSLKGKNLEVLDIAPADFESENNLTSVTDSLLDKILGDREFVVEKILFGVPESWVIDEELKDEYLKILRNLVKELELQPMAYVASSHALAHLLEKQEGVPTTAILIGFESKHTAITVVRAGKLDGTKVITRTSNAGVDIEKALLAFTQVETLPSKILLYSASENKGKLEKIKMELLTFPFMSKLSFLHFPKIEILDEEMEIKSICFAGGSEIQSDVLFVATPRVSSVTKPITPLMDNEDTKELTVPAPPVSGFGFVVGDVSSQIAPDEQVLEEKEEKILEEEINGAVDQVLVPKGFGRQNLVETENLSLDQAQTAEKMVTKRGWHKLYPSKRGIFIILLILFVIFGLVASYIFVPKASVKIYVEPRILERDSEVVADPKQDTIDEEKRIIPGQIVETEVTGTEKSLATGTKEIGDPAKGVVVIRNKLDSEKTLSKGTVFTSPSGLKFSLDTTVSIASRSAEDGTYGKATANVLAKSIGAEGNLPSGTDLSIEGFSKDQLIAKSEGNFSGGTSKKVTVVSEADQKKLLAQVASNLKREAQKKLQEKLPDKKVLEEALSEKIIKKNYSKNINDQANDFSLSLTIQFRGTSYDDKDLKQILSKIVTTQVPEGFQLSLEDTETQSDVSKLETDGKLIFLARFRAKMIPKIDTEEIKHQVRGKRPQEVSEILKEIDYVLGSDITIFPQLPAILQKLPYLEKNINVEVGLK